MNITHTRGLYSINESERLVKALWHNSNIRCVTKDINQDEKADKIDGVRVMHIEDEKLLSIAENLIHNVEKEMGIT